jgi:cell wall-associated NlpC family hydrolase
MRFAPLLIGILATMTAACASSTGGAAIPRPFPGGPVATSRPKTPARPTGAPLAPNAPLAPDARVAPDAPLAPDPVASDAPFAPGVYDGRAVAEYALAFRGVPYRFGGADPVAGFDCSGLVQYVFAQYGIYVPRVVEEQWQVGNKIKPNDIKPGDLLFFSTKGPGASHVAIALDSERFVHAPNSTGVVRVETLSSTYWGAHYIGARRLARPTTSN